MADADSWDADNFEPDEPMKKAAVLDKWEGEDEEEDVKVLRRIAKSSCESDRHPSV